MTTSPLKYHGGKSHLGGKILELMAGVPHVHYVEPFFGGGSVLLRKDPNNVSEVANDIDGRLVDFWATLADEVLFAAFLRKAQGTPFSEAVYQDAVQMLSMPPHMTTVWARGWAFFVLARQSLAGRQKAFAPLSRNRTRAGMNEQASAWLSAVEGLPEVHERMKRVVVLNQDALDVVRRQDGPNTLFYLDPPYHPRTRTSPDAYAHEMTHDQHVGLLTLCAAMEGIFFLSGYRCPVYDQMSESYGWSRFDFEAPNSAAGGATKRTMTESVWTNRRLKHRKG